MHNYANPDHCGFEDAFLSATATAYMVAPPVAKLGIPFAQEKSRCMEPGKFVAFTYTIGVTREKRPKFRVFWALEIQSASYLGFRIDPSSPS